MKNLKNKTQENKKEISFLKVSLDIFLIILISVFTGAGIFFIAFFLIRNFILSFLYSLLVTSITPLYIFIYYFYYEVKSHEVKNENKS